MNFQIMLNHLAMDSGWFYLSPCIVFALSGAILFLLQQLCILLPWHRQHFEVFLEFLPSTGVSLLWIVLPGNLSAFSPSVSGLGS